MDIIEFTSNFFGALSLLGIVLTLGFLGIFLIDTVRGKSGETEDEIRERLEEERENCRLMGIILYWATVATEELEMDPAAREEVLEAIDTFDDLMIEDRIHFI